jgi:uncharacterized membrane protein YphA (DoxX/SURF4 family)
MTVQVLLLLIRLSLGWYLLSTGWDKLQGELTTGLGTFYQGGSYQRRSPAWLPHSIALAYGYALPWLETGVGVLLVFGLCVRASASAAAVLFASIATALAGAGELFPRHHLMVFLPVALFLAMGRPGPFSLDAVLRKTR